MPRGVQVLAQEKLTGGAHAHAEASPLGAMELGAMGVTHRGCQVQWCRLSISQYEGRPSCHTVNGAL